MQLGVVAASAAFQRAGVEPGDIDYAVIGQVVQAGAGHIPSRQVTLATGVPEEIGSDTINKVCASGMRAVALADLMVRAGDRRLLLAGGMESMSSAPYLLMRARSGYRFGDGELLDANLSDGLRDPWSGKLMYEQASAVADELGLARGELDEWALRSHQRAVAAIDSGRMAEEIVAVEVPERGGPALVDTDEAPRRDTTLERLAALPPLDHAHPTHTAGNSPGVNDGAAMLVVADADLARERGLEPLARILATGCTANRHDSLARVPAPRRADRARARRPDRAGHGRDRDQRGVRVGRAAVVPRPRRRHRAGQRQRRRRRARPSGRGLRRAAGGDADVRAAAPRRRARPGRDLLGRRTGRRDRDRGRRRVIERVLVVGAGQMGAGIAQVAAAAGMRVTLVDVGEEQLERGLRGHRGVAREARGEGPVRRSGGRAGAHLDLDASSQPRRDAELAIEAASEDWT